MIHVYQALILCNLNMLLGCYNIFFWKFTIIRKCSKTVSGLYFVYFLLVHCTLSAWVTFATKLCTIFCTSFKYYDILFCKLLTLHKLCRFLVGFLKNSEHLAKNHRSMMYGSLNTA